MIPRLSYGERCRYPDFRFHIQYSVFPERECPVHTHDFAELVVVCHGRGMHVIDNQRYPVVAGDVFVVRPGDVHGYSDIEGMAICNVVFDPEAFLKSNWDLCDLPGYHALFHLEPLYRHVHEFKSKLHLSEEKLHYAYQLIARIEEEYIRRAPGFQAMIACHLGLLAGYLSRQYTEQETPASRELLNLFRVRNHIEENYREPITLDDLAQVAYMSKNSLLRAFSRCYGSSPIHYLIQHRLSKACELLRTRRCTITEAAHEVGFSDSNYFARQFRRAYGISPRDYREGRGPRRVERPAERLVGSG